jgi:hypothetical protein
VVADRSRLRYTRGIRGFEGEGKDGSRYLFLPIFARARTWMAQWLCRELVSLLGTLLLIPIPTEKRTTFSFISWLNGNRTGRVVFRETSNAGYLAAPKLTSG